MKMEYLIIIILALLLLGALLFSGRAVVKTSKLSSTNSKGNIYYHLPTGLLKITSKVKVFIFSDKESGDIQGLELISQSFEYENEIVPDNSQILLLVHSGNPFAKDDLKLKINNKGLLTTVNVVAEDRTPNIIEAISKAPAEILSVGGAAKGEKDQIVDIEEFTKIFTVDPSDLLKPYQWVISKNDENGNQEDLEVSFQIRLDSPPPPSTKLSFEKDIRGIVTRPLTLYKFSIHPHETRLKNSGIFTEFFEYLPNTKFNIVIPISRALFAKKTNNLTLENGLIVENKIEKPSEVEGFVSIPINLAKAIVSIPGQLFTFRIDNTKKQTELEKEILNLEKSISARGNYQNTKELETQKLQLEADKNLLTVKKDLEILKNEVSILPHVSELENDKKIIGLQKDIQTLTAEANKLKQTEVLANEKEILQLKKEIETLKKDIKNLKNN